MTKFFNRLMVEQDGASMVEYALTIALLGAAAIFAIQALSLAINDKYTDMGSSVGYGGAASVID